MLSNLAIYVAFRAAALWLVKERVGRGKKCRQVRLSSPDRVRGPAILAHKYANCMHHRMHVETS